MVRALKTKKTRGILVGLIGGLSRSGCSVALVAIVSAKVFGRSVTGKVGCGAVFGLPRKGTGGDKRGSKDLRRGCSYVGTVVGGACAIF